MNNHLNHQGEHINKIEYVTVMAETSGSYIHDTNDPNMTMSEDGTNDETNYTNNVNDNNNLSDEPVDRKKVALYEKWVTFFESDGIKLIDDRLVCSICNRQISADKKSRLNEHVNSKKHKKNVELPEDQRPSTDMQPYTPAVKRIKTYSGIYERKADGRDKSHEILMADTLNLFVQLDVPFERLNSEVWQNFVKKHVKNGEHILKNFQIYSKPGTGMH